MASLRWARLGAFDAAIPAAMAVVAFAFLGQLGRPVGGLPFGLVWIVATAAANVREASRDSVDNYRLLRTDAKRLQEQRGGTS